MAEIMIVDDNPANLKVLGDMLALQGYEVRAFPRGRLALTAALRKPPDLVLLDINMPEMNGYDVCEQFKADPRISNIPIIILSAFDETEAKVKGFQCGAVDYISKPFRFEEINVRVETHLKMYRLKQQLERQNEHLEATVAARTRELAEANARLTILDRSKTDFLCLISHELRTPLNGLLGIGEIMTYELPSTAENDELKEAFQQSGRRFLSIVEDALFLTEIDVNAERYRSAPISLRAALAEAVKKAANNDPSHRMELEPLPPTLDLVIGNTELLVRAFQTLLAAAGRLSEPGGTVRIECEGTPDSPRVVIENHGRAIPKLALESFFDIFSGRGSLTSGWDLGLGPPVASRILSLFGATAIIESVEPSGFRLIVSLLGANLTG